jgi:pyruvate formate lyase activating enzyme
VPATALIADIRRNALDDGPGIRSTVFFKGCPLRCVWCQNPETLSRRPQLQRRGDVCLACGSCAERCEQGAVRLEAGERLHDAARCRVCGSCVEVCPPGALRVVGTHYTAQRLVQLLLEDEPFYRNSGGGVTFSGGEPTLHLDYLVRVSRSLKEHGVNLLLETCGHYRGPAFEALLPLLDTIYFDVKLADPALHEQYTGRDNRRILDNLKRLADEPGVRARVLPRVPLVPGITDTPDNLATVGRTLRRLGFERVALLPYNPLWPQKRSELGLDRSSYNHPGFMQPAQVAACQRLVADLGLETV